MSSGRPLRPLKTAIFNSNERRQLDSSILLRGSQWVHQVLALLQEVTDMKGEPLNKEFEINAMNPCSLCRKLHKVWRIDILHGCG